MATLNAWLDALPRARFGARSREVPAFRTIGVAGFYLALAVTLGTGLATGRSVVVLAIVSVVCGMSFFAWALLRRLVTGRESLVLFEHVWLALACSTVTLAALGAPVLAHLDPVALGLCAFLAVGRIGCLVVGCCYGQPSVVGITYGEAAVADGFPRGLAGVRLFPVQLVEAIGLAAIGISGAAALPFVPPGTVFSWFLLSYALLRFGDEGLRGDDRRTFAGLSVARWGAIAQASVGLWLADPQRFGGPAGVALLVSLLLGLAFAVGWQRTRPSRRLRDRGVLAGIRDFIERASADALGRAPTLPELEQPTGRTGVTPAVASFAGCLTVAVSAIAPDGPRLGQPRDLHISFSLGAEHRDLETLADTIEVVLPEAHAGWVAPSAGGTVHVRIRNGLRPWSLPAERTGHALRSRLARWLQDSSIPHLEQAPATAGAEAVDGDVADAGRAGYFGARGAKRRTAHAQTPHERAPSPGGRS